MSMPNNFNHFTGKKKKFSKRRRKKRIKVKRQHRNKYRKALEAVRKCEGLTDNTRITALENTIKEIKEALKNVLATE